MTKQETLRADTKLVTTALALSLSSVPATVPAQTIVRALLACAAILHREDGGTEKSLEQDLREIWKAMQART